MGTISSHILCYCIKVVVLNISLSKGKLRELALGRMLWADSNLIRMPFGNFVFLSDVQLWFGRV